MTATKKERQAETVKAITDNTAESSQAMTRSAKAADKPASFSRIRKPIKAPPKKPEIILRLLKRSKGARMQDLQKATGWQAHSIRAALTGLRKQGVRIDHSRTPSGKTIYKAVEG
ncbi:DUF3489 domain-containing protein [uncultured Sneathiella sp.]|jgi:hypothetical protein|uniref:DUF3489 domain-containing protein n=1 Tax=uncultured Sneathiella sp. TaxID=879315 RepID=UPI0030DB8057|tara:strand:- start:166 stop:510 length:345 start_codon:yes stop_codon:yes gene_type:complete